MQRLLKEAVDTIYVRDPGWEERYQQILYALDPREDKPGRMYVANVLKNVVRNNTMVVAMENKWTKKQIKKAGEILEPNEKKRILTFSKIVKAMIIAGFCIVYCSLSSYYSQ